MLSSLPVGVRDALPQLFVETTMPLALIDADGALLTVNSGFCALVGRSAAELTGATLGDVLHPDERATHLGAWQKLLDGIAHADRGETRVLLPDGRVLPVDFYRTVVNHRSPSQQAVGLVAIHGETARPPTLVPSNGLADFAEELASVHDDQARLGAVVARTLTEAAGDGGWLWCVDDDRTLRLLGSWHGDPTRRNALSNALSHQLGADVGVAATAISAERLVQLGGDDATPRLDPLTALLSGYAARFGIAGLMLVPLRARDRVIGVAGLVRDGGASAYEEDTVEQVADMASTAALGLDNSLTLSRARADERFARAVLDAMPVMAAVLDSEGNVVDVNAAWLRAMGSHYGPLRTGIGENYLHMRDTAAATGVLGAVEVANGVREVLQGVRDEFAGDCAYPWVNRSGEPDETWLHVHASRLTPTREDTRLMVVVDHQDITDRKVLEARLSYEATHDPLTKLPNRTLLLDRVEQALVRDRRAGVRTAVLFCDLDYFKQINDQFGHDGGDAVLRAVAQRFGRTVRASDTVSRIGGDEFVVLVESVSDLDESLLVADKLVLSLQEPPSSETSLTPPLPGVSIGVALSQEDSTAESLLRDADAAMYTAKQTGRSRVEAAGT